MVADVRPYLVPTPNTVVWEPVLLWDGEGWTSLPDAIDGWDPGTDLHIRRYVHVDTNRLTEETRLHAPTDLAVVVSWTSSTSGMTEAAPPVALSPTGTTVADAALRGDRIGGILWLRSTLSVVSRPAAQA